MKPDTSQIFALYESTFCNCLNLRRNCKTLQIDAACEGIRTDLFNVLAQLHRCKIRTACESRCANCLDLLRKCNGLKSASCKTANRNSLDLLIELNICQIRITCKCICT